MSEKNLSDETPIPLKWIFGLCAILVPLIMALALNEVSGMRDEIQTIRVNITELNKNINVLLTEREYTKLDISLIKQELKEQREKLYQLEHQRKSR